MSHYVVKVEDCWIAGTHAVSWLQKRRTRSGQPVTQAVVAIDHLSVNVKFNIEMVYVVARALREVLTNSARITAGDRAIVINNPLEIAERLEQMATQRNGMTKVSRTAIVNEFYKEYKQSLLLKLLIEDCTPKQAVNGFLVTLHMGRHGNASVDFIEDVGRLLAAEVERMERPKATHAAPPAPPKVG